MIFELIDNQDEEKLDFKHLEEVCRYISIKFDPDNNRIINIIFIDDKKMKDMNRKYRNIDRSTDVLSFSRKRMKKPRCIISRIALCTIFREKTGKGIDRYCKINNR